MSPWAAAGLLISWASVIHRGVTSSKCFSSRNGDKILLQHRLPGAAAVGAGLSQGPCVSSPEPSVS